MPELTDKLVRDLPSPKAGNKITPHGDVPGLGVRTTAAGHKAWVFEYRVRATGLKRRITLGDAVSRNGGRTVMTVKDARKKAEAHRQQVADGKDPMGELHIAREAPTMNDLAARYLKHAEARNRVRTIAENKALLDKLILPDMGNHKITAIEHEHIARLFAKVTRDNGKVRANRVHSVLRRMFNLAILWKLREDNPAVGIERNHEENRERYLEPDELKRLMAAIAVHKNRQSANIIALAMMTGARRGELLNATWDQFDLAGGRWIKPSTMTKQQRVHRVPLSKPVLNLLGEMKAAHDQENARRTREGLEPFGYLFPGSRGAAGAQQDLKHSWASICKTAGIDALRFHDLRHSFASFLVSGGANLPLVGQMLGHSSVQATQRYAHLLDEPQRKAAERIGAIVNAAGDDARTDADVVPL
jgi:integrase